jgi:hypothetical protein
MSLCTESNPRPVDHHRQYDEHGKNDPESFMTGHGQQARHQEQRKEHPSQESDPRSLPDHRLEDEHVDRQEHEQGGQAPFFRPEAHDFLEHRSLFAFYSGVQAE